ncbi:MAG: type VI secretion system baseplate subunit TssK [Alphaproteobacteria bacterium]
MGIVYGAGMEEKAKFKIQDSVQWYEGQLLYPHHYQQMRHEIQQLSLCYLSLAMPWYWGIRSLEIDQAVLNNGLVRVNKIFAVFPDGSVFEKDESNPIPLEIDISNLKDQIKDKELTIYLAVVKRQDDTSNVEGEFPRYVSREQSSILDENTGETPLNIAKLCLSPILVTEDKLSARLSAFPLLKLSLQSGTFQLTDFIPPATVIQKDHTLGNHIKILINKIRRHIGYLSTRLESLKLSELDSILEHYARVYRILTSRILSLEMLYESGESHPHEIYKELTVFAGSICALMDHRVPPTLPPYHHDDLKTTFAPLLSFINERIDAIKNPSISILFHQEGRVFSQDIKEHYLSSDSLIVGLRLGPMMSAAEGGSWIKGAVISCDSSIKDIKEKRILGAEREIVDQIPEMGLVSNPNYIFIKIKIDPTFIKIGEAVKIFNPSDREDARPEDLFLYVAE